MAKELPYFKFFVSEWADGDITLETLESQGLFINVCAYYWSNQCIVEVPKLVKKFQHHDQSILKSLFDCGILKDDDGFLRINFLNEQKQERTAKSLTNSKNGSLGGRPKKRTESERKANALFSLSETKAIKRREEKKREENSTPPKFIEMETPNLSKYKSMMNGISQEGKKDITLTFDGVVNIRSDQFDKLIDEYDFKDVMSKIYSLSAGIHNEDKKYTSKKDHYRTVLAWLSKDCKKKSGMKKPLISL